MNLNQIIINFHSSVVIIDKERFDISNYKNMHMFFESDLIWILLDFCILNWFFWLNDI